MMKWIDIVSPSLRKLHQTWLGFRGTRLVAHLNGYNRFVGHAPRRTMRSTLSAGAIRWKGEGPRSFSQSPPRSGPRLSRMPPARP